jgi:hypothetical protein
LLLISCSKAAPEPDPAPSILGTWERRTERIVGVTASGTTWYDNTDTLPPGEVKYVFDDAGKATLQVQGKRPFEHAYAYGGGTLTLTLPSGPSVTTVTELSLHRLVYQFDITDRSTNDVAKYTYTYTR